jgi:hypothetical protein
MTNREPNTVTIRRAADRPYRLRTVNGSRINYVVRVADRAVGRMWRTHRDDRRAPWAWRIRMSAGAHVYDLTGEAPDQAAAEVEVGSVITRILRELRE